MMKILPVSLIRAADAYTIAHEPIADIDLMERAASSCCKWLKDRIPAGRTFKIFCGSGNNGGDGLAIGRMLLGAGFRVEVFTLADPEKMSESCRINYERIRDAGYLTLIEPMNLPDIRESDIVIDAIFGSGLTRPAEGHASYVIRHINASGATVVAIDVPSGLFCDETSSAIPEQGIIHAHHTLTFAPPKLAFFFAENERFAGNWHLLDIGIHQGFIDSAEVKNFMVEAPDVVPVLRRRARASHKGTYGHALVISGSTGKMGAAVLAAKACLRSGPGLVTLRIPRSGVTILQSAVPEAMADIDPSADHFSEVPGIDSYSSIAIGPGIGTSERTAMALKVLIQQARIPVVFDADAINILAENKTWLGFLPKGCIFTPHPKEFERIAGKTGNHFERNRLQREFSFRYHCYVVLKGAFTAVTTPDGRCFFNTTGNPGMATGGSGDVLTGILTGLMAQGYTSLESCLLGVYVHGLAGDLALSEQGFESLIAGDIIDKLGKSFQSLYGEL
jgi:NAD(P)H-hydrate epimerase